VPRPLLPALLTCVLGLSACGGGAPRARSAATPPPQKRSGLKAERFEIRGANDNWHEPLLILDGLKRTGGVKDAYVDEATGKYVVVYEPRRTYRDKLRQRIIEIGKEQNRSFDPIFDDR
jgi:hypothetical protein